MAIAANNPLLQPGRPLAGNALLQAATALANAQTQPTIDALRGQIGQNSAQTQQALGQVGNIYQGLGQQAQSEIPQIQGVGNDLNARLGQIGQDEQSQLKGIGDSALQSLMKYAPQPDAGNSLVQPALGSLATEIARQQGLAAQSQGAFKSFGATQGANYNSLAGAQLGSFAKAGQEALRGIATAGQARNQPLSSKLASVLGQRGSLISADAAKLRQQEIANGISEAGLGIRQASANASLMNARTNQGKLEATVQNDLANQKLRAAAIAQSNLNNLRTTQTSAANAKANNSTRLLLQQMKSQASANKPATRQQVQTTFGHISYLQGEINNLVSNGVPANQAYSLIANGGRVQTGVSSSGKPTYKTYYPVKWGPEILNAAFNTRSGGSGLTPGDVAWLNSLGIPTSQIRSAYGVLNTTGTNISQGGLNSPH